MKSLNKTLRVSGICVLICIIFNIVNLVSDILYISIYHIIIDSMSIFLTLFTGISYIVLSFKDKITILEKRKLFLYVSLLNVLNNIFVWGITVYINLNMNRHIRVNAFRSSYNNKSPIYVDSYLKSEYTNEPTSVEIIEPDIEIMKNKLKNRLDQLQDLKRKGLITNEDYLDLRNKAIQEFMK